MKKIILLFGIVLCGACSENKKNNKPTFNPTTQETVVTNKISNISKTVSPINGNIALSVIVQNNLPSESAELLKSKIINIITHNGIASQGVNPQIIVAPTLTEINYDITSTLPQKHKINYSATIYIGNILTGKYPDRRNIQFNKQNAYRSRRFKGISYNECHFFYLYK